MQFSRIIGVLKAIRKQLRRRGGPGAAGGRPPGISADFCIESDALTGWQGVPRKRRIFRLVGWLQLAQASHDHLKMKKLPSRGAA